MLGRQRGCSPWRREAPRDRWCWRTQTLHTCTVHTQTGARGATVWEPTPAGSRVGDPLQKGPFCPPIRSDKLLMIAKPDSSLAHTGLFICLCNATSSLLSSALTPHHLLIFISSLYLPSQTATCLSWMNPALTWYQGFHLRKEQNENSSQMMTKIWCLSSKWAPWFWAAVLPYDGSGTNTSSCFYGSFKKKRTAPYQYKKWNTP